MSIIKKFLQERATRSPQIDSKPRSTVLVCDGTNLFIRAFCASNELSYYGNHIGGIKGFLMTLGASVRNYRPTKVIIVFDGDNGSRKRKMISPDYKANRTGGMQKVDMFQTEEEEKESKTDQLIRLTDYLKCLPVTMVCLDDVEADDVVAFYATYFEEKGNKVIISSSDKDYLQKVNENITVYRPNEKVIFNEQSIIDKYGVHPNNFANYLSMMGDDVDGVKGISGMGKKTVVSCFPQLTEEKRVTIEEIIDHAKQYPKRKQYQNVANSEHILKLNYKLIDLEEPMMSDEEKDLAIRSLEQKGIYSPYELSRIIINDKIPFEDVSGWAMNSFSYLK